MNVTYFVRTIITGLIEESIMTAPSTNAGIISITNVLSEKMFLNHKSCVSAKKEIHNNGNIK